MTGNHQVAPAIASAWI